MLGLPCCARTLLGYSLQRDGPAPLCPTRAHGTYFAIRSIVWYQEGCSLLARGELGLAGRGREREPASFCKLACKLLRSAGVMSDGRDSGHHHCSPTQPPSLVGSVTAGRRSAPCTQRAPRPAMPSANESECQKTSEKDSGTVSVTRTTAITAVKWSGGRCIGYSDWLPVSDRTGTGAGSLRQAGRHWQASSLSESS